MSDSLREDICKIKMTGFLFGELNSIQARDFPAHVKYSCLYLVDYPC